MDSPTVDWLTAAAGVLGTAGVYGVCKGAKVIIDALAGNRRLDRVSAAEQRREDDSAAVAGMKEVLGIVRAQNTDQQEQINTQRKRIETLEKGQTDCIEQHKECEENLTAAKASAALKHAELQRQIDGLKGAVTEIKNGK